MSSDLKALSNCSRARLPQAQASDRFWKVKSNNFASRSERREAGGGLITGKRSWLRARHSLSCLILYPASVTEQYLRQNKVSVPGTSAIGRRTERNLPNRPSTYWRKSSP